MTGLRACTLVVHQHLIQVYRYRYACIRCWCTTGANLQDEAQGTILCAAQPVHGIVLCALPLGQCHSLGYGISSREGRLRVIRYRFSGEQVLTTSATGSFPTGAHSVTSGEMIPRGTFVLFPTTNLKKSRDNIAGFLFESFAVHSG